MATTITEQRRAYGNQIQVQLFKCTAGVADGYVEVEPEQGGEVMAVSVLKTVGTIGSTGVTFTPATGKVRAECTYGNADELKLAVFLF